MKKHGSFIKEQLGYKLIVNQNLIKLEKIPGIPKSFMGINEFTQKIEYIFLCFILMFLETKAKKEQFILSQLIDYIKNISININELDIEVDFNLNKQRRAMVVVLKYIKEQGFIKLHDGQIDKFTENIDNEVLYEVTGISKYFVRIFNTNIQECNNYLDIIENENLGLTQDTGKERRQRVYRRLITECVVYNDEINQQDYMYIKQYKNVIEKYMDNILGAELQVHKNGAFILVDSEKYKNVFPSSKGISDVVLFVNTKIIEKYKNKEYERNEDDTIHISKTQFLMLIKQTKDTYGFGFSKEHRDKTIEQLAQDICKYMKQFEMIRTVEIENDTEYILMPIVFKLKGTYPKDVVIK